MERSAFKRWMARTGLVAALLLVLVPTIGRVAHAAAGDAGQPPGAQAHHGHAAHAHAGHGEPEPRPAIGDPDCDYCPLLAAMAMAADVAFDLAHVPRAVAADSAPRAPRLRWWHPNGLGSRGPPRRA